MTLKETRARYYQANKEKLSALNKKWLKDHPERVREASAKCKARNPERAKTYRQQNRERIGKRTRAWKLKKNYGLTPEMFDQLLQAQNGACAICARPDEKGRKLHVDHCHVTGKVRGLLCSKCNSAIGYLEDDLSLLRRAVSYLEPHQ